MATPPSQTSLGLQARLDGIAVQVRALVAEREALQKRVADAEAATATLAHQLAQANQANTHLQARNQMLRLAHALPPEDNDRRDLKLKINAYIRQIDQALASLGG